MCERLVYVPHLVITSRPWPVARVLTTCANVYSSCMFAWGYVGTLEATLSLDMLEFFGWGAGENCTKMHVPCRSV